MTMIKKCITCNEDFEAKRDDAKCCSSSCRSVASRKDATDNATDKNVTIDMTIDMTRGVCHGCQRKVIDIKEHWANGVGSEKEANLVCICGPCIRKGVTHESLGIKMCE